MNVAVVFAVQVNIAAMKVVVSVPRKEMHALLYSAGMFKGERMCVARDAIIAMSAVENVPLLHVPRKLAYIVNSVV